MKLNIEISTLVASAVNVHGELHLDKERTSALVDWLRKQEEFTRQMTKDFEALQTLLKPIIAPEK